ncbi:MAG: hypothetical protein AAB453_00030 [Patescibacteria group bacterium]
MESSDKDGSLESLRGKLYGRERTARETVTHSEVPTKNYEVPRDWQGSESASSDGKAKFKKNFSMSFLTKLLLVSFLFFVLALGTATYFFYRGSPYVSSVNLALAIEGPETVRGGEAENFQITITNNNNSTFEFAELVMEYPEGTVATEGDGATLKRARIPLGALKSGQSEIKNLSLILFGEKDSEHILHATVEYRISGSNAIFDKSIDHKIKIISSPLDIDVKLVEEVNSGQEVELAVEVISNTTETVNNLMLMVSYPPGFIFKSAMPAPVTDNNGWKLGDLKSGDKRKIKITGLMEGQDDEVKAFKISVGLPKTGDRELGLTYNSLFKTLAIKKPYVNLDFSFNGETTKQYFAKAGDGVRIDINWVNNLSAEISDVELAMKLEGPILDSRSVAVEEGFFDSQTNTITWTKRTKSGLAILDPGARGRVSFNLATFPITAIRGNPLNNPTVKLTLTFKGKRLTDGRVSDKIELAMEKKLKIDSFMQLSNNLYYNSDTIPNHGPLPPKVGQETTYTVVWSVINAFNNINNAQVRATLPSYVKWLGKIYPENEKLSYNSDTGEIIWNIGELSAGQGYANPPKEVSFQIGLTPSISQLGRSPVLLTKSTLTADDVFTERKLESAKNELTTHATEPGFRFGDETVTQ